MFLLKLIWEKPDMEQAFARPLLVEAIKVIVFIKRGLAAA